MKTRGTEGFTLVEVLVAMVILGIALLGVQASITDHLVSDVGQEDTRATAAQLAASRIHEIASDPDYGALGDHYAGTENPVAGAAGFQRTTAVRADDGGFTTVSVRVTGPAGRDTVTRTLVIGAP
ncbi:MAG TPA: prepilin-type N-terminal cleavage/methylation domain-containing protein [Longimicrobiaceae bacterium]|nr:prepilin-type N-terminal cleavage/methylation domain-containing protein [Longimicrobiaceae bacterium]